MSALPGSGAPAAPAAPAGPVSGPRRAAWADDERLARAALSRLVEPGDPVAGEVVARCGPVEVLRLVREGAPLPPELEATPRARRTLAQALERWAARLPSVHPERDLDLVQRRGGRLLVPSDAEWPRALDDLGDAAPLCLWVRGTDLTGALARSVAIVGSRACTPYGDRVAVDLSVGLVARGVGVVSGGAYGVDAAAHRGAVVGGGTTVAVLACGVDEVYPRGNRRLMEAVLERGALVAEVPPGSTTGKRRFLQRNRLIAAVAGATVVVEAAWRSGALSTAHHAAGLGRPLGVVPGPITSPASAGCHRLLREVGATCVTDAAEITELLDPLDAVAAARSREAAAARAPVADHDGLPEQDLLVLDALRMVTPRDLSSMCVAAGLTLSEVEASLGRLAVRGLAVRAGGGWRRAHREGA